jgi:hypothetical protein
LLGWLRNGRALRRHVPDQWPLFVGLVIGVILIVGGLTFFPALALGPIVEHLRAAVAVPDLSQERSPWPVASRRVCHAHRRDPAPGARPSFLVKLDPRADVRATR